MEVSVVPVRHEFYTFQRKVNDEQNPKAHTLPQVSIYFTSLEEAVVSGGCGLVVAFTCGSPSRSTPVRFICAVFV